MKEYKIYFEVGKKKMSTIVKTKLTDDGEVYEYARMRAIIISMNKGYNSSQISNMIIYKVKRIDKKNNEFELNDFLQGFKKKWLTF